MCQGLATEPELHSHHHHGFEVVNMDLNGGGLDNNHDKSYQMDHEEVEDLFKKLDKNNDGRIDLNELAEGLKNLHGSRYKAGQAQQIMNLGDQNLDGQMSFEEFVKYVTDHQKKLWIVFQSIDQDGSGCVDKTELKKAFEAVDVKVTDQEVDLLLKSMDKDKTLKVNWKEWREYHLLNPSGHSMHDIIQFWRHSNVIDIGEDMTVPDEFTEEEKVSGMWWRQLVAGGGAGVVSRTSTAPLDRLKVLLQVQASSQNRIGISSGFSMMIKEGGIKSLWRGNGANVVKIAPESAIKFFAYERAKKLLGADEKQLGVRERLMAGSMAGVASQTSIYPLEVLKTRLALRKTGQYKGLVDAAYVIFTTEGIRSFYRGLFPSLLGIIPYAGIDLAVYETLKNFYLNYHKNQSADPGVFLLLACGTASSTCGQLASYPLSLVRTKLQAQARSRTAGRGDTMVSVIKNIIKEDGPRGLYRGLAPNFMKVAPAVSISYVVYEHLRMNLGVR
ncbi:mitochondrial adenyl nucleotide antiporter SLC25A25-like [Pocillopora verrucosa]|uniref:calcium-binding mitochondrial carrier protein SCaMC-2-like n=1 Tax=Pocillopora damicornis TaxID=46731 RepID=UPI000F558F28|nr:calcium-binding mitochondrial carrier protein SCaMC-2-like [Pocillopora damicornis]XP_058969629.1 mitochondrial adenyl nucleotide antiporter SLC25A25-like [Pocillopora verrucosa]